MVFKPNPLLDLAPGVGEVRMSVRFELISTAESALPIGELHPASDERMSISNNTTAAVKRTLRGFELDASEAADINLFRDRVRPVVILEDGTTFRWGEFMFSTDERTVTTAGNPLSTTLMDQSFLLNIPRPNPFGLDEGEAIVFWIDRMAEEAGIPAGKRFVTANPDKVIFDPVSWPQNTPRMRIMTELAELAGYFSPYFDNNGNLICRPAVALVIDENTIPYDLSSPRIIVDTLQRTPNLLEAPNRYIAINNGAQNTEIVGVFEVPPDRPQSYANRGFYVDKIIATQGLDATESAADLAEAAANQDPGNYEQVTFESTLDPRHDTFDIVTIEHFEAFIEIDWTADLEPGGAMRHSCRKTTTDLDNPGGG